MASPNYQHLAFLDLEVHEPDLQPISLVRPAHEAARWDDEQEAPRQLSAAELHALYAGTTVLQHRYLAPALDVAVHSPTIAQDPAKWFTGIAGIHLPSLVNDWLMTSGNTEYEQLNCVGLDASAGELNGILTVKQRLGYCGGAGTAGSREYVAFWVDWGAGFQYEGTASVAVHDLSSALANGRQYHVSLPVDLSSRMESCTGSMKMVKVRAVLSWNTPPSTTNANAAAVWGNRLECQIPVPCVRPVRAENAVRGLAGGESPSIRELMTSTVFPQKTQAGFTLLSGFRLLPHQNGALAQ